MAITIHCECGVKLQVKDEYAGQEKRCPKCNRTLHIPRPEEPLDVLDEVEPVSPRYEAQEVEETEEEAPRRRSRERKRESERERDEEEEQGEITDHGNEPLPPKLDFFADPPKKIGPVISACSTLRKGQKPWSAGARTAVVLFVGAIGLVLGMLIVFGAQVRSPFWAAFWPIVLTAVLALIAFLCTGFSHTVTYVGREGLARYQCTGDRDNVSTKEVFQFHDAQDLRTKTVLHYTNGVYQHTAYTYTWSDINGNARFIISGQHNSEAGNPDSLHDFHFARQGEIAWTIYLLHQAYRQVEMNGSIQFNLTGNDWIRLSESGIKFKIGGMREEWRVKEVRTVSLQAGTVMIKHRDAQEGWFSSSGVVKFQYDQLANAQLFFHVMEKIVGIPVSG